eukprot:gene11106-12274_t
MTAVVTFVWLFYVEIGLAILVNGLILATFVTSKSLRKRVSNLFLMNLVLSDLLTAVAALIPMIIRMTQPDRDDAKVAAMFLYVVTAMMFSYLLSVLLVTLDRFIAIVTPYRYQSLLRRRNAKIIIFVSWLPIDAFLITGIALAMSDDPKMLSVARKSLTIAMFIVALTGIVFLVIANLLIFREVRRQVKLLSSITVFDNNDNTASKANQDKLRQKELRAAYLCFAIVALFVCTWGPFAALLFTNVQESHKNHSTGLASDIWQFVTFAGLIINPCLYVPFTSELRNKLKAPFRKFKQRFLKTEEVNTGESTNSELATNVVSPEVIENSVTMQHNVLHLKRIHDEHPVD